MFKIQKSLRFIVTGLAIITVFTLAIAANWRTSYAYGLHGSNGKVKTQPTPPDEAPASPDAKSDQQDLPIRPELGRGVALTYPESDEDFLRVPELPAAHEESISTTLRSTTSRPFSRR